MIPTRPLSPLLLSEAATAGRRYDGAISVPDLAWAMQCTQTRARQITKAMVAAGRWVEKGVSSTGARCYGEPS